MAASMRWAPDAAASLSMSGRKPSRAVAFFAAAMFTQTFDNMMLQAKTHVLGTPNRNAAPRTDRAEDAAREPDEKYNVDVEVEIRTPSEKNDEDQSEATDWIISDFSEEEAMARRSA
jgi:hypothetical protein